MLQFTAVGWVLGRPVAVSHPPLMSSPKRTTVELPRPIDVRSALVEVVGRLRPIGGDFVLIGGVALGVHGCRW